MINVQNWTTWGKDDALFYVLYFMCEFTTATTCAAILKRSIILSSTISGTMNQSSVSGARIIYRLAQNKA
jgi:hypothetical protein